MRKVTIKTLFYEIDLGAAVITYGVELYLKAYYTIWHDNISTLMGLDLLSRNS